MSYWYLSKEGSKHVIRKRRGKSQIRYPAKNYPKDRSKESLQAFVIRLNGRDLHAIKVIKTKLAFMPVELQEEFRELLLANIPNQTNARYQYNILQEHLLDFFVTKMNLLDPTLWKTNELKWGQYLLNGKRSASLVRAIVQVSNQFMSFLHKKLPKEVQSIRFEPYSRARFKQYSAKLKMKEKREKFISDEDWELIESKLPIDIAPMIKLAYYYGLRRSECVAFKVEDVREGYLAVERQAGNQPLKNRDKRQTPHWFCTPEKVYGLIQKSVEIHPATLGHKWSEFMETLGLDYQLHDLRRTFITKALKKAPHIDVMHAVGHANIETTMRYLQDDRKLNDSVFVPKAG